MQDFFANEKLKTNFVRILIFRIKKRPGELSLHMQKVYRTVHADENYI